MAHRSEIDSRRAARSGMWILCTFAAVCAIAPAGSGQNPSGDGVRVSVRPRAALKRNARSQDAIRLDINVVLVPVTVTDPLGAPVSGLPQKAFRLFEDGVEQELKYFATDDAPVSAGVVFDASRSMERKLDESRAAVSQFFRTSMPGDEFFLVEFNDAPRILSGFTTDTAFIERSLSGIQPKNWTALFDAVYLAVHQMKHARHQRRALLIISDGADNNSRYTESEITRQVREADVCIYSIGITAGSLLKRSTRSLKRLSEQTGGHLWDVDKLADLPEVMAKISRAIRNQYLLGFSPRDRRKNGQYRRIQVKLDHVPELPPLRASWRGGYYSPSEP